jgi:hypothetical protein
MELENFQTSSHILVGKESLSNRKFTSQREVNNKIYRAYSDLYCKSFPNFNSSENLSQHRTIPLGSSSQVSARSNGWISSYAQKCKIR